MRQYEAQMIAEDLFHGGWRAEDRDEIQNCYGFEGEDLDTICDFIAEMEVA